MWKGFAKLVGSSDLVACTTFLQNCHPLSLAPFLPFTGIYFLKKQGGDDFPMWPAYVSQALAFGGGLLGEWASSLCLG